MASSRPQLPLVLGTFPDSARHRLKGPPEGLEDKYAAVLRPEPTTVSDDGAVRFGDSLLLLSHGTEVLLQTDVSRELRVVDDSHSQRREFSALLATTARVLHPCARNCFSVARAGRDDGFPEDDLQLHYGQTVRLLARCSLVGASMLYLHLQEPADSELPVSTPVFLPRAAGRTAWRVLPAQNGDKPVTGQVVHVNEPIELHNVETGRLLMSSTAGLAKSAFGAECPVSAEPPRGAREAVWSFVNEHWTDAVAALERKRTGGYHWKLDEGDDFVDVPRLPEDDDGPAFRALAGAERKERLQLLARLADDPGGMVVTLRVLPVLRAHGVHGARKLRRSCSGADVPQTGVLAARTFDGVLMSMAVKLAPPEFRSLCEAFREGADGVSYTAFFQFLEGDVSHDRLDTLKRAYRKLRTVSSDFVTVDTLLKHWSPQCYPGVLPGSLEEKDACKEFASQWEVLRADGHVSPEDFVKYYRDVSICYEDTTDFIDMVRAAWDL